MSQHFSSIPRRWLWCLFILVFWVFSAALAGFAVGWLCYFLPGLERLRQSPQLQIALFFAAGAALLTLPLGLRRIAKVNRRLSDVYARRAQLQRELEAELRTRGRL